MLTQHESKVMARCGLTNLAVLAVLRHTQQSGAPPTIALSLHDTRASCCACLLVAQASEVVKLDVTSERHDVAAMTYRVGSPRVRIC